jgi:Flp pilus assembly protein TadG
MISRRALGGRRGSQAVEFALILPVVLGLSSGIIDYGWYFSQQLEITQAARDAARGASSLDATASELTPCEFAQSSVNQVLSDTGFVNAGRTLTILATMDVEMRLTVEIDQPFTPLFGLAPTPTSHRAVSVVRLEDQNWPNCSI